MMKHRVADLTGEDLDIAVAMALGHRVEADLLIAWDLTTDNEVAHYSIDWAAGGPIIERERIELNLSVKYGWYGEIEHPARPDDVQRSFEYGPTPLLAAMRAYVASKLGETVELP